MSKLGHLLRLSGLAACLLLLGARADAVKDQLTALENAILQEEEQRQTAPNSAQLGPPTSMGRMAVDQLRQTLDAGYERQQVDRAVGEVSARYSSPAVKTAVAQLQTALRDWRARSEMENQARVDTVIEGARKAILTAEKPSDLDASLDALEDEVSRLRPGRSGDERGPGRPVSADRDFVKVWQDYLSNKAAGYEEACIRNLEVASDNLAADLVPRSFVLERARQLNGNADGASPEVVRSIVAQTKSLDDIPRALDQLGRLPKPKQYIVETFQSIVADRLSDIANAYESFRLGLPMTLEISTGRNLGTQWRSEANRLLLPLRTQVTYLAIPRFLGVAERPRTDEAIEKYLERIMAMASERVDARLMCRVVELRDKFKGSAFSIYLPAGLVALLAAQNQEEAGQYEAATISYERALGVGGKDVPSKAIGARLNAIRLAHPAEFEKGLSYALPTVAKPLNEPTPNSLGNGGGGYSIDVPAAPTSPPP